MNRTLVLGAGGVGSVVVQMAARQPDLFGEILLASRTLDRCQQVAARAERPIRVAQVDADDEQQVVRLLQEFPARLVIHVALPYQNLAVMKACLAAGADYLDTATYETRDLAKFEYRLQWELHERFRSAGRTALLGCGFDPGVTNVFCAYARKHLFDRIDTVDILDCNGGSHGRPFATNFNAEINLREVVQRGRFWEDGRWQETDPLSVWQDFDFPGIGQRRAYLMYHDELESLARHFPEVQRLRFWMTFSEEYLNHLRVLQNVGLTSIEPVEFDGRSVVPLQVLKALLPDPASLAPNYRGKTCIGCLIEGSYRGQSRKVFIDNICDHEECFRDVESQAISYTTGVAAVCGASLLLDGTWRGGGGVFNVEEFDPDPFLERLGPLGLPWQVREY
ncbi:MAG: saccharopine dehydrogenase family protein [Planctomycetaceae bacterium]|nr:saccharopine dehydrogenase family protein [Planctomycetaceae bacterium]